MHHLSGAADKPNILPPHTHLPAVNTEALTDAAVLFTKPDQLPQSKEEVFNSL